MNPENEVKSTKTNMSTMTSEILPSNQSFDFDSSISDVEQTPEDEVTVQEEEEG